MNKSSLTLACALAALLCGIATAQAQTALSPEHQAAHDIFKELIEINTTDTPVGNLTAAAEAMAAHFRAAGFSPEDIHVDGPLPNKKNLVVRLHGRTPGKPILFLAHLDVVEALRRTGPWIHSSSVKWTASFTVAARRISNRATRSSSPTLSA